MKSHSAFALARRTRLGLERLEERETPAGVVALSLASNTLTFTGDGDAAGNEVRITALSTTQFLIEGLSGTTFTVGGVNIGATIDTGNPPLGVPAFPFPNDGTTAIKATFTGGRDRFEFDGSNVNPTPNPSNVLPPVGFGVVTLNMGAGNDTVILRQFVAKSVTVNSTLTAGTDNDLVQVLAGGIFDFNGDLTPETYLGGIRTTLIVNGQAGNDTVNIAARIAGNVTGTFRDAGDTFTIQGASRVGGAVTVTESPTTVLGTNTFSITENSQIAKNVTVTNLNNALNASVNDATVGGSLTLRAGSGLGGSNFSLNNTDVGSQLSLTGGTGADTVTAINVNTGRNLLLNMGNGGNAGDSLIGVNVGGSMTVTYGTGNDSISVQNTNVAGSLTVNGGEGIDTFFGNDLKVGLTLSLRMGNGGNGGGGDFLSNVTTGGGLTVIYGASSGDDLLQVQNSTIAGTASVNAGAGLDRFNLSDSNFNRGFSYIGGLGGNGGIVAPDVVADVFVAGTFRVTYGAGNEELQMSTSTISGAATILGANGNDVFSLNFVKFLSSLAITGGIGVDAINAANLLVVGATRLTTSGGDDTVNITQSGQYQGRVTINTGGAGSDNDTLNIEATANVEITFLGGLAIATGAPLDTVTIGTQPGNVIVLNGFIYPEAATLDDNPTLGNNLLVL